MSERKATTGQRSSVGRAEISGDFNHSCVAFAEGAPVALDEAVQRCAALLSASAQPVFAHLGVDVAGAREAILIADRTGGVVDHVASEALLRDLDPLRETGGMTTTPLEADVRADVVLLVGDVADDVFVSWTRKPARAYGEPVARRVVALKDGAEVLQSVAELRRQVARSGGEISETAALLKAAKFGVAVWRAADLPALAVEALHGLVRDLNETTRFSTLALAAPDNGLGVQMVCGWMTGFPLRTGFGRGFPEHDPLRYDTRRMIAAGETDCVVWVSSLPGGAPPPPRVDILLDDGSATFAVAPRVRFVVNPACFGVVFDPRTGTLAASPSTSPSSATTALAAIRASLEMASC